MQREKVVGSLVLWDSHLGKAVGGVHPDLCEAIDVAFLESKSHFARSMKAVAVKYQEITAMEGFPGLVEMQQHRGSLCGRCRCGSCQPGSKEKMISKHRELGYQRASPMSEQIPTTRSLTGTQSTPGLKTQLPYPTTEMQ